MSSYRTLLLTDVVDSTALTARLGDAGMSSLWAEHDRLAHGLLRTWRGREIDRSDGFLLLLPCVDDAVGFALEYHRALTMLSTPMTARAGIHAGPVVIRESSTEDVELGAKRTEVNGLAKPVAARVMSLAMGGQTLLTATARQAMSETTALRLQSHGHWRLKGLDEPIELFEVGDDGAPFEPPPDTAKVYRVVRSGHLWLPVRELPCTLPAERTPFFGRKSQLQALASRLDDGARLISVLGTGGMGKTRLVQRFGWTWLGDYPGGVWFCDLSQATSLDGIAHAVAQGLNLQLGGVDPLVQIGLAIAGRGQCLVILDNFEQVVHCAEQSLGGWLNRAREARFVVTTREVLGIAGEEILALPPMLPAEAATLFAQRARAVRADFGSTPENQEAIEPLMRLLDSLPLAIELAAARVSVMPPRLLLQRMSERFRLLAASGARPGRQTTLRGAFDWSWDLLSLRDKKALAQLSVFEAGFDVSAAEAVLDLSGSADEAWTIDVLQSLVNKSLIRQVSDHRFDLLRTVQEYAAEHLRTEGRFAGSGEAERSAAARRHWRHFACLGEQQAVADECVEIDNLVAACRRAAREGDGEASVACLVRSWAALRLRGPFRVAVELASTVRDIRGLGPAGQTAAECVAGSALLLMGQIEEARQRLDSGLLSAQVAGDELAEARLLAVKSETLSAVSLMDETRACLERSLALAVSQGDRGLQCNALNLLGVWFDDQSMLDQAQARYEAALVLSQELGDRRMEGGLLGNLGGVHLERGRLDDARRSYSRALQLAHDVGDRRWEGSARCNLGLLDHEQGRASDARAQFERALAIAREIGHARLEAVVQCNLGLLLEAAGDRGAACGCYEQAVTIAHELGSHRSEAQFRIYLGRLYARQDRLGLSADCLGVAEGLLQPLSDLVTLALLRCSQAELAHRSGDAQGAARAFAQAQALAGETGAASETELGRMLSQVRTLLGGGTGDEMSSTVR